MDDKILHYLLIGVGIAIGSFIKFGIEKFWEMEWSKWLNKK